MRYSAKNRENKNVKKLLYLFFALLLLAGCASTAAYREPVTRFQQASTIVIEGARVEYKIANKRERDAVIDGHVDRRQEIHLAELNDKEIIILDDKALAVRMAALDALSKHGQLLLTLASSDAPARARDAANSLDDALVALSTSIGEKPSDELTRKAHGFTAIAAEVTKLALESRIQQALDKAIFLSENDVITLMRLLENDLGNLYERQKSHLSAARVSATTNYNDEVRKPHPNPEKLQKAALAIKNTEDAFENLSLAGGTLSGLDAMADAHRKLVEYAKSSKNPQDLAELVEATDAFVTRAKVIGDAIKTIQQTKE